MEQPTIEPSGNSGELTDKKPYELKGKYATGNGVRLDVTLSNPQYERFQRIMTMRHAKSKSAVLRLLINLGIEAYEANPKFQRQLEAEENKEQKAEEQRREARKKDVFGKLRGI